MDAIMASLMLTVGVGIHVILWAIVLDWVNNRVKEPINWYAFAFGLAVMLIGSFFILTSIIIVVKVVLKTMGAV